MLCFHHLRLALLSLLVVLSLPSSCHFSSQQPSRTVSSGASATAAKAADSSTSASTMGRGQSKLLVSALPLTGERARTTRVIAPSRCSSSYPRKNTRSGGVEDEEGANGRARWRACTVPLPPVCGLPTARCWYRCSSITRSFSVRNLTGQPAVHRQRAGRTCARKAVDTPETNKGRSRAPSVLSSPLERTTSLCMIPASRT